MGQCASGDVKYRKEKQEGNECNFSILWFLPSFGCELTKRFGQPDSCWVLLMSCGKQNQCRSVSVKNYSK